jgi:hypothetical protein
MMAFGPLAESDAQRKMAAMSDRATTRGRTRKPLWCAAISALALLGLGSCNSKMAIDPPPRATDSIEVAPQSSYIAVPISADLDELAAVLEREVPRQLWTIDKPDQVCVAPKKVDVLGLKLKTPKLKCRITGVVTRGAMTISGSGERLIVDMPLHAVVSARDIAGILSKETAEADARVRAVVRLDLGPDWEPRAKVDIGYDWTREPGIDFLGQRITFTSKADAKLQRVVAQLERVLPRELRKLAFRRRVQRAWAGAFTSLQLNSANPPVWMRITPQQLRYGGYAVDGRTLTLRLGLYARTETFVGDCPSSEHLAQLAA